MLRTLRTGHSHEDIDQLLGVLAKFLATKVRTASEPSDFVAAINTWMTTSLKRPHDARRYCVYLDQARDWNLALILLHEESYFLVISLSGNFSAELSSFSSLAAPFVFQTVFEERIFGRSASCEHGGNRWPWRPSRFRTVFEEFIGYHA